MEQILKGIALVILLSAFIVSSPSPTSNEDSIDVFPPSINNEVKQDENLCPNVDSVKPFDCSSSPEKCDSVFHCF